MPYDVVIRNGIVVDGGGGSPFQGDVAIADDIIAAVGKVDRRGLQEIDAEGHVVTPGFIDGHTHMDAQIFWDQLGSCSCWHGITTAVMGHCGFTLAPASFEGRDLVLRNLERAEDISGAAMAAGIDWEWTTFADYLNVVDRLPKGINYAANIGHSALRTYAMGERAFSEEANADDLELMCSELRQALLAGAKGLSTSRTRQHETSDGHPVASRLASWHEIEQLVRTMGEQGGGLFQLVEDPPTPEQGEGHTRGLAALATTQGVTVVVPATTAEALEILDTVTAAGGSIFGLAHSRGIGNLGSFKTRLPFDSLPEWSDIRALPHGEQQIALQSEAVRARLVWAAHHCDYGRAIGAEGRRPDFGLMKVLDRPVPPNPSVAELAHQRGIDPVELIIDLAVESHLDQFFVQTFMPFDHDTVKKTMKHPHTVMTFSDAGAHVSQMSDCSIQSHLLAYWVRDRQDFTLQEAIRMLTYTPAQVWGLSDRGLIREGMVADINVLDPARVAPEMPYLADDLPGGEIRIMQRATGFLATLVAGQIVHYEGSHTGALPGRLIRGSLADQRAKG
jgi:N-acyl-D-amino-acid deacylase